MRKLLIIALILVFGVTEADARRRHRHRHYAIERYAPPLIRDDDHRSLETIGRSALPRSAPGMRTQQAPALLIPAGWQLQPTEPDWKGKRYVSPDGTATLALYAARTDQEPIPAHKKTFAFVEGEELTFLQSERDWIVVSGLKGDRMFYRKAALACGGKSWHHVAFEYPAEAKRSMEGVVTEAVRALDDYENTGCDPAVSSRDSGPPSSTSQ
jgi:hypothetical protein